MKKTKQLVQFCCVFLAGLMISNGIIAQEQQTGAESRISPKFGIKGGINLSNLYVDDVDDENMKLGINGGFYAKLPVAKGFSIQPELLYSNKGSKLTYNNPLFGSGEYRFNLHYVEVPVLAVINVAKNFNLHVGPYASYLVAANITDLNDNGTVDEVTDLNADNFNRFDWGLSGGLGIDVGNLTIGARYSYGFREVGESGSVASQLTSNSKNSVVSVFLGLAF
jgi:Outer membrane protein beta-barrel domain